MRDLFQACALGILLSACAFSSSKQNAAHADQQELANVERTLRVGMSLEEVKEDSPRLSECRGSPKSYMTCTGSFRVRGNSYLPMIPIGKVGDADVSVDPLGVGRLPYKAGKTETLTLHFKENKLERWENVSGP